MSYTFHYIYWEDLIKAFTTYIKERPSEKIQVLSLDRNSVAFIKDTSSFEEGEIRKSGDTFIIPTQINSIQGYDFRQDSNKIIPNLKDNIAGKTLEEARAYMLSTFPEIGNVRVSISPLWYTTIPTIKSRIQISVD